MRVLLMVLLLAWAAPASAQRVQLETGTVDLLPGFELRAVRGTDSYPGTILRADSSLVIHYDIGGMAGTRVGPQSGRDFLWMVTHEVNGHRAYTGMYERDGRRGIATTIHGDGSIDLVLPANFLADVRREQDIADFLLIVATYRPRPPSELF